MMQYANYKVHTKFTSTRLSDPLCHSVKRGLTDWREREEENMCIV